MPKKSINDIRVPTYDDLFTNEEQRQEAKLEKIMEVPVEDIHLELEMMNRCLNLLKVFQKMVF